MKKIFCCLVMLVLITNASVLANYATKEFVITCNDKQILSYDEVFEENSMVYLPLEKFLDRMGITDNPYSYLTIDNNRIALYIYGQNTNDIYNMEIGKREIVYTQSPVTYAPATRETMYAPIVRNEIVYIPFEYIKYIFSDIYCIEVKSERTFKDDESVMFELNNIFIITILAGFVILTFVCGYIYGKGKR